jgi:molecular chaperone GrpE
MHKHSKSAEQERHEDGTAEAAKDVAGEVERLTAALADKEKEISELKDKYLRVLADSENARKRIRQQSEDSIRIQRENFLRDLLPIADNLERAVEAARASGDSQSIVAGVEMVLRAMLDFLKGHGVTQINAVGQPFDPQLHEAVDHAPTEAHPPNTVISEHHRGYQIGDRMLRPARVTVARRPEGGSSQNDENNGGAAH